MRCIDISVLLYAHREDLPQHREYRGLLEEWTNADEPLGIPDLVFSGFLRVITNRRVFADPSSLEYAVQAVDDLLDAPAVMKLRAGERHWSIFRQLIADAGTAGNDVADAYLAAYAVENNATWHSADRGFARFPLLRYKHPLDCGRH